MSDPSLFALTQSRDFVLSPGVKNKIICWSTLYYIYAGMYYETVKIYNPTEGNTIHNGSLALSAILLKHARLQA